MGTPAQDYADEVAAAESAYTADSDNANTEHTGSVAAATTALGAADTLSLATIQGKQDESFTRALALANTTEARALAVATETHDRKEADSVEKMSRKITDLILRAFSGVDYFPSGAGTALEGARYPSIDLAAPLGDNNSLELAIDRLWQQLKNFQIDTTSFLNSRYLANALPITIARIENCGNFDTGLPYDVPTVVTTPVELEAEFTFEFPFGSSIAQGRSNAIGGTLHDLRRQVENLTTLDSTTKTNLMGFVQIMTQDFQLHKGTKFWGNQTDSYRGNQGGGDHIYTVNGQQFEWGTLVEFQADPDPGTYGWYCAINITGPVDSVLPIITIASGNHESTTRAGAIGEVLSATETYGLVYAINHSALNALSKTKAIQVAGLLRADNNDNLWAQSPATRSGNLTADGQTYSYVTTVTGGGASWFAQVTLQGPLSTSTIASSNSPTAEWYDTPNGAISVDSRIYSPPSLYFSGVNASAAGFDGNRLAVDGLNYFLVTFAAIFDVEATVWYRVLDAPPPLASSPAHPWKVGTALGGAVAIAKAAGRWPTPYPFRYNTISAIFPVTVGAAQYLQFGVNCLSGYATRPSAPDTRDLSGHFYGGMLTILGFNTGIVEARAYPA